MMKIFFGKKCIKIKLARKEYIIMKRITSILLVLVMTFSFVPQIVFATKYNGICGRDIEWVLDTSTYTLTIEGTGDMIDYSSSSSNPWFFYSDYIESVEIAEGITSIGNSAFLNCYNLKSATIPNGVINIGKEAFCDCERVTSVTIPNSVTNIEENAFFFCKSLTDVIYGGSKKEWENIIISSGNAALTDANITYLKNDEDIGSVPSAWAKQEVNLAINSGLTTRNVKKNYQANITREQFCEMVVLAYEKISGNNAITGNITFTDTNNSEVRKAANLGIVNGYGNGVFAPDELITREQICAMLVRMIDKAVSNANVNVYKDNYFKDKSYISDWALSSVNFAYDKGIIQGVGDNCIAPLDNTTCEQAILLVYRIYNNYIYKNDSSDGQTSDNIVFTDEAFEQCVRLAINDSRSKPFEGTITEDMLENVIEINTYSLSDEYVLKSIEDIERLPNIISISIDTRQKVKDYSPIGKVKKWQQVDLEGLTIEDDSFLDEIQVFEYTGFPNLPYLAEADYYDDSYTYNDALELYRETLDELDYISNNIINDDMSDYDKYKALHDYIILKMRYDMDEYDAVRENKEFDYPSYPHYLSRVLSIGKGVCADYATGYASLCSYFGLECYTVHGVADGIYSWDWHEWNIVKIDGNYYHVDTTWDDPDKEEHTDNIQYDYFLKSDDEMGSDHIWDMNVIMEKLYNEHHEEKLDNSAWKFNYYDMEEIEEIPICSESY